MKDIVEYFNEEAKTHDKHFINRMGMAEFYDQIETLLNSCEQKNNILVLGCGTGLEIERIKFQANVVAIDISPEMINELRRKTFYKGVNLNTICASILEYEFGKEKYDIVLTCYTLHHFNIPQKEGIFQKIHQSLKSGGVFINGDTMAKDVREETQKMSEAEKIYLSNHIPFASLHIDAPLTFESELLLLKKVDFQNIILEKEWTSTKLYKCLK